MITTPLFTISLLFAVGSYAQVPEPVSVLGRQGEYMVKNLLTPPSEFNGLSPDRKAYIFSIAQAIEAGRDIIWLQSSPAGKDIRDLLETVWEYRQLLELADVAALKDYLFQLYRNHANYDVHTNSKILPMFTLERFREILKLIDGKSLAKGKPLHLERKAEPLLPDLFDPKFREHFRGDSFATSAPVMSEGDISPEEMANAEMEFSRKAKRAGYQGTGNVFLLAYPVKDPTTGKVEFQLAKIGGRFDAQLRLVDEALARAWTYATPAEKEIIDANRRTLRTGSFEDALAADRLWVRHEADVDFVIGFVETYLDRKGQRGAWEGFIVIKRREAESTARVEATRKFATVFEALMPVEARFRKVGEFTPPKSQSAYLFYSGGAAGATPFGGKNLPNDSDVREELGSKSWPAANVISNFVGEKVVQHVDADLSKFFLPEYLSLIRRAPRNFAADMQVEFHEILGHGSGRNDAGVGDEQLGDVYNPIEEGRAEVASLFQTLNAALLSTADLSGEALAALKSADPSIPIAGGSNLLSQLGIIPSGFNAEDVARYMVLNFFTRHLDSYITLGEETVEITQAHQLARQAMLTWMVDRKALEVVVSPSGPAMIRLGSLAEMRDALGAFWAEIQTFKSAAPERGNSLPTPYGKALAFLKHWGRYTDVHRAWRLAAQARSAELGLPKKAFFLNPVLTAVTDVSGRITDVKATYAEPPTQGDVVDIVIKREKGLSEAYRSRCDAALRGSGG